MVWLEDLSDWHTFKGTPGSGGHEPAGQVATNTCRYIIGIMTMFHWDGFFYPMTKTEIKKQIQLRGWEKTAAR